MIETTVTPLARTSVSPDLIRKDSKLAERRVMSEIGEEVDRIKKLAASLADEVKRMKSSLEKGETHIEKPVDLSALKTTIKEKRDELLQLEKRLVHLSSSKKAKKLGQKIIEGRRSLEFLEKRRASVQFVEDSNLSSLYRMKREAEDQLQEIKRSKMPATTLVKTLQIFDDMESLSEDQSEEVQREVELERAVLRKKMGVIAEKALSVGRKEKRLLKEINETPDVTRVSAAKIDAVREALLKKAVLEIYFPEKHQKQRREEVVRWMTGFQYKTPRTQALKDQSAEMTKVFQDYKAGGYLLRKPEEIPGKKKKKRFSTIAVKKQVKAIGKRSSLEGKQFDQNYADLLSGRVEYMQVLDHIADVHEWMMQAESELKELRAALATHSFGKTASKIEQAINQQMDFIEELKNKRKVLEVYAQQDYAFALAEYKEILYCVEAISEKPNLAGYRLFEAHHKVEALKVLADSLEEDDPIRPEIVRLAQNAESLLIASVAQGAATLTKSEEKLLEKFSKAVTQKRMGKLVQRENTAAKKAGMILAKVFTEAMYFSRVEKTIKTSKTRPEFIMIDIESFINNLSTLRPKLWQKVLDQNDATMQRIIENYQSSSIHSYERERGVAERNSIFRNLEQAKKDKTNACMYFSHACMANYRLESETQGGFDRGKRLSRENSRTEAFDAFAVAGGLAEISDATKRMIDTSERFIDLTKSERALRDQLFVGDITKKHTAKQLRGIISKEIAAAIYAKNTGAFKTIVNMFKTLQEKSLGMFSALQRDQLFEMVIQDAVSFLQQELAKKKRQTARDRALAKTIQQHIDFFSRFFRV